ncbi:hypothetical protein [Agrococcus casei]|uniref:hypothetical protein n=1 Tax=Agrococcus casei TaxID=343512 RepID=UPI003F8E438E
MMVADYERRLAAAETELENWNRRKFPGTKLDHGTLNLPLAQRGITDADLSTYRRLTDAVSHWRHKLARARWLTEAPARREAKVAAHDAADLKARYGECGEVLWVLSGRWHPVERWNRKSVKVAGLDETIPHTQVAGAR